MYLLPHACMLCVRSSCAVEAPAAAAAADDSKERLTYIRNMCEQVLMYFMVFLNVYNSCESCAYSKETM